MTQPPIHPQYYTPPPGGNIRPTSVTVLAILGIIFGAFGVLCSPVALAPYFITGVSNPVIDQIKADALLFNWMILSAVIGWVMSLLLLICSIGALGLKPWARQGLLVYGFGAIAIALISLIINLVLLFPRLSEIQAANPQARGAMMGGVVGAWSARSSVWPCPS